ncbi:MAG TPA: outer membrane protein transport protein [Usitatibacter sp.]|nr:outer membrane protein transport protein [Usitatibacter sp.]
MRLKLLAAVAAAAPFLAHATDGYFSHGYGMVAKGMGGASMAVTGSGFGAANNPATMVFSGNTFEIGVDLFSPWRTAERTGAPPIGLNGSADSDSNYFGIPEIAYNRMANPNLSWGITVYGNGGMNTDYPGGQLSSPGACGPATGPGTGFNPAPGPYNLLCGNGSLGVDLSQLIVAPSVAWKFAPDHSIGIAPLFAYQRFKAEGLQAFAGLSTSPGNVTNQGYDSSSGWGARIGYYGRITPQFQVGASYATKMSMQEFGKYKGLFAEAGGFDIPSHFGIGFAFEPDPQWQIAVDYERINYSDAKSVSNPSSLILNCAGGDPTACLGGSNGAGFGWKDIDVFKLGVQYQYSPVLTLRAGYNYSQNPIKPEDVTFNFLAPGVVQHHVTAGATWTVDHDSYVTMAAMYAFQNDVTGASLFNAFAPGLTMQEKIKMYEYSIGVQYQRRF